MVDETTVGQPRPLRPMKTAKEAAGGVQELRSGVFTLERSDQTARWLFLGNGSMGSFALTNRGQVADLRALLALADDEMAACGMGFGPDGELDRIEGFARDEFARLADDLVNRPSESRARDAETARAYWSRYLGDATVGRMWVKECSRVKREAEAVGPDDMPETKIENAMNWRGGFGESHPDQVARLMRGGAS